MSSGLCLDYKNENRIPGVDARCAGLLQLLHTAAMGHQVVFELCKGLVESRRARNREGAQRSEDVCEVCSARLHRLVEGIYEGSVR